MAKRTKGYQESKHRVVAYDSGGTLDENDLGKIITIDSTSNVTINLPAARADLVGEWVKFQKQGTGYVYLPANGTDVIGDSNSGATAQNETTEQYTFLELVITAEGRWDLGATLGAWYTS